MEEDKKKNIPFVNFGIYNEKVETQNNLYYTPSQEGQQEYTEQAPVEPFDEAAEEALWAENEIFVTQTPLGEEISLFLLKRFVDISFIPRAESKNNWVALWQFMIAHNLLKKDKRTPQAFANQMNKAAWYGAIDPQIACSYEGMRYYTGVQYFVFDEWDKILEKTNDTRKTNEPGLLVIKKLYKLLEKDFKIEAILR